MLNEFEDNASLSSQHLLPPSSNLFPTKNSSSSRQFIGKLIRKMSGSSVLAEPLDSTCLPTSAASLVSLNKVFNL